ncbi:hypothetical protein KR032_011099 [Drosophila birchii]|nr:hypothetical protein KR032_011099 [Drosophila birchii]
MPCIFNPGYIGPNPPGCDPDCVEEGQCTVPGCGVCPESQLPRCNPAREPKENPKQQQQNQEPQKQEQQNQERKQEQQK